MHVFLLIGIVAQFAKFFVSLSFFFFFFFFFFLSQVFVSQEKEGRTAVGERSKGELDRVMHFCMSRWLLFPFFFFFFFFV
jgi:hypothetical protein